MLLIKKIPFILFGLLFSGVGAFIFVETGWQTFSDWQRMQSWQPVQAQLISIKGYDNDTKAEYRYQVGNRSFQNDRVYLASFKDNIGSYHADLQDELKARKKHGDSITVWFNPYRPSESVIDRDIRWGMMTLVVVFCAVFVIIGLVVIFAAFKSSDAKQQHSTVPVKKNWQTRKGWESANIRSDAKSTMWFLWASQLSGMD